MRLQVALYQPSMRETQTQLMRQCAHVKGETMPPNGAFVQQTPLFNVQYLKESEELKELLVQLIQQINNISLVLNMKETGYYDINDFVSGQMWYPIPDPAGISQPLWRPGLRTCYPFAMQDGTVTPVQTISTNLNLTANLRYTRLWGIANEPGVGALVLPFVSDTAPAQSIQLDITGGGINVRTGTDYSMYTDCTLVLEYVYNQQ